jgi:UDP-N-acetylglucosamine 2-epimerase
MKGIQAKDKLEGDGSMELSVICPLNHQAWDNIVDEFRFIYATEPINSIADYGRFYTECLNLFQRSYIAPDIVVILGDRFELLAAATAALLLNIPIAHLHGAETTLGAFDNEIKNSITQMATYHFTATHKYAENVARMRGLCNPNHHNCLYKYNFDEIRYADSHIYSVGSPGLDWLTRTKLLSKQELQQYVSIDLNQPFIVACLHPTTKEPDHEAAHALNFMAALTSTDEQILLISPNCDPKNDVIRQVAQATAKNFPKIHIVSNLDHIVYLSLLQYAEFMVGNSSSGIIESASFDLPSVSVGNRQAGRIRGNNIFDCPCETEAILTAIDRAREWNATVGKCDNPYGDGKSSERIVKILEEIP